MLLDVTNLSAGLEDGKQILNDLNIQIGQGETHVLMGPNGAGKSSLGNALMGNPVYKITGGKILFKGEESLNSPALHNKIKQKHLRMLALLMKLNRLIFSFFQKNYKT